MAEAGRTIRCREKAGTPKRTTGKQNTETMSSAFSNSGVQSQSATSAAFVLQALAVQTKGLKPKTPAGKRTVVTVNVKGSGAAANPRRTVTNRAAVNNVAVTIKNNQVRTCIQGGLQKWAFLSHMGIAHAATSHRMDKIPMSSCRRCCMHCPQCSIAVQQTRHLSSFRSLALLAN